MQQNGSCYNYISNYCIFIIAICKQQFNVVAGSGIELFDMIWGSLMDKMHIL